jgi:hypothetical protein
MLKIVEMKTENGFSILKCPACGVAIKYSAKSPNFCYICYKHLPSVEELMSSVSARYDFHFSPYWRI